MRKRPFLIGLLLLFLLVASIYGQDKLLVGTVTDSHQKPLTGLSVSIKGTLRGVQTNHQGNYQLAVSLGDTIVFASVGMNPQEVLFHGQLILDVCMVSAEKTLDEVVVVGYQTMKKADLTGAVSVFQPDRMKNVIVTGAIGDVLGSVPGLMVRTMGNPGSEGNVLIRGMGTFGNSEPLYVVDGMISGANRDFNFNDVESIQVLKDASAAAIYGSRAGNGVIIITTKQGREGEMKIDVSSRLSIQWLPRYNLANRKRWIELNDLAFTNAGRSLANHFDADTDWQKETFKNGLVNDHNISFSGGSSHNSYFISANYQSNSGTTIGANSKRYTLRSNTSGTRFFGENVRLRLGENIILSHYGVNELNTNPVLDVYRMLPTIPIYDIGNAHTGGYGYGDGARDVTFGTNPLARENIEDTRNSNLRVRGNVFAELKVLEMFTYRLNVGLDYSNDKYRHLRKEGSWTYNQPVDPSNLTKQQAQYGGVVYDNTLEFDKQIKKHALNVLIGTSYQSSTYEPVWAVKNGVLTRGDTYYEELDAALEMSAMGNYKNQTKLFSVFGRLNYQFDNTYLFSFTLRRDESSKFPVNNRVGYFPSVSVGWRMSNEEFFQVSWVDDLKVRVNYGVLGTSNNGEYDYMNLINLRPQVVFGNDVLHYGMTQTRLAYSSLKWEEIAQLNMGLDALLLQGKLLLSADYFVKKSRDVLTKLPISIFLGHSGDAPWVNAATIQNKGVEVTAGWKDHIGKDASYRIGLNFSYMHNKLVSMGTNNPHDEFNQWSTKSKVGKSIGQWYLIKTDGLFRSKEEVEVHRNSKGQLIQPDAQPGDVRFIDANDDGFITDADRQYCGENMPKVELGMDVGFHYKAFDLQMVLSGAFGHKTFNGPRSAMDAFSDNSNYRGDYDSWTPDNPLAKDPRPIYGDTRNVRGEQDRWLENGNYLKVKQLVLGYSFPQRMLGTYINQLRLFVNAQNILTISPYTGLDPEFLNMDIWSRSFDGGSFPNPKAVTFGMSISF